MRVWGHEKQGGRVHFGGLTCLGGELCWQTKVIVVLGVGQGGVQKRGGLWFVAVWMEGTRDVSAVWAVWLEEQDVVVQ